MDEAMSFVKARPRPIAVYVFTKNKDFERKASTIQAGSVVFNDLIVQVYPEMFLYSPCIV